jgi:hypothetical protein
VAVGQHAGISRDRTNLPHFRDVHLKQHPMITVFDAPRECEIRRSRPPFSAAA